MADVLIGVDGGGSKTHLAVFGRSGDLLALRAGPTCSPQTLGLPAALAVLDGMRAAALHDAGLAESTPVDVAVFAVSGLDLPREEQAFAEAVRGWAADATAVNDIFAILRAGTDQGFGVAVVAGTGTNAVAVSPSGEVARFLALGDLSGDRGGGWLMGRWAVGAAVRGEDGRGPTTMLAGAIAEELGRTSAHEVAEAVHFGELPASCLPHLARLVLGLADRDEVAAELVARCAGEIVDLAVAAAVRTGMQHQPTPVVLSGGLLQSGCRLLIDPVLAGIAERLPAAKAFIADIAPIGGAALIAADRAGMSPAARDRLTSQISTAVVT